ncbi:hypothetical protein [Maribacter sp. 2307ULW6-5]|uniref:hypothetical protein n=1 Tax=Maribacter sp. 2307ULW6-5 TaxID=3386275 RepID=UPI0039BD3157
MNIKTFFPWLSACALLLGLVPLSGQMAPGVYMAETGGIQHEIKTNGDYFIYSAYKTETPEFLRTLGGFSKVEDTFGGPKLIVLLEFNSDYEKDALRQLSIPISVNGDMLELDWFEKLRFTKQEENTQDLDGAWLFATRGPDEGQDRRGDANTRKTLKYLQDGRFQWVAYDTEGFKFMGTGGGAYGAQDGTYTEHIGYFSRDNSRVGASLSFDYEVKGADWHHKGNNSRGEPMYEIWSKRYGAQKAP